MKYRIYPALLALLLSFILPSALQANTVTETFSGGTQVMINVSHQQYYGVVYYIYDEDDNIVGAWDTAGYSYAPLAGLQPSYWAVYGDYSTFDLDATSLPYGTYTLEVSSIGSIYYVDVY